MYSILSRLCWKLSGCRWSCLVDSYMCSEAVQHNALTESLPSTWFTATTRGSTAGTKLHRCSHVEHTSSPALSGIIYMPLAASSKTVALRLRSAMIRTLTTGSWCRPCHLPTTLTPELSMLAGYTSPADIPTTISRQTCSVLTRHSGRTWHQCWRREVGM